MKKVLFAIAILIFVAPLLATRPVGAEGTDSLAVWKVFEAAFNRSDVDGMVNTFSDDAVLVDTHPSPGLPGVWVGKDQIRELFKGTVQPGERQTSSRFLTGSGGNSEQLTVLDVKQWSAPGVDLPAGFPLPVEIVQYLVVQNGKIKAMTYVNPPEWLVKAGALGTDPGTSVPPPLGAWKAFLAAANKGDAEGIAALFADDGVLVDTHPSKGLTGVWVGKNQIRELFNASVHPGDRWDSGGYLVGSAGNTEQMTIETVKDWLAPGPDLPAGFPLPVESSFHLIVHDGHIRVLTMDNKPEWLAKAGVLGQSLDLPVGMPTTGVPDPRLPIVAVTCLAVLFLLAGSLIRRTTRRSSFRD